MRMHIIVLRRFPDFEVVSCEKAVPDGKETYTVRDKSGPLYESRDYGAVVCKAVFLQEMLSAARPPDSYVKVPLISSCGLRFFRTVDKDADGNMIWTYIAEGPDGDLVLRDGSYTGLYRQAVLWKRERDVNGHPAEQGSIESEPQEVSL